MTATDALDPPAMTEKLAGARDDLVIRALRAMANGFSSEEIDITDEHTTGQIVAGIASIPRRRRVRLDAELERLARAIPSELVERHTRSDVPHLRVGARIIAELASRPEALVEVPA